MVVALLVSWFVIGLSSGVGITGSGSRLLLVAMPVGVCAAAYLALWRPFEGMGGVRVALEVVWKSRGAPTEKGPKTLYDVAAEAKSGTQTKVEGRDAIKY